MPVLAWVCCLVGWGVQQPTLSLFHFFTFSHFHIFTFSPFHFFTCLHSGDHLAAPTTHIPRDAFHRCDQPVLERDADAMAAAYARD
jgi:lysozyme family protein